MTATLRVTRQVAEVLAAGTPQLHVTRQVVEVLGQPFSGSVWTGTATDTLSFGEVATTFVGVVYHAVDTLTLTQSAVAVRKRLVQPVADNLLFNQLATVVFEDFNPAVGDTLSFGETVVCVHRNLNPKAADNLVLNDYATVAKASRFPRVQDTLAFVEAAVGTTLPSTNFPVSAATPCRLCNGRQ